MTRDDFNSAIQRILDNLEKDCKFACDEMLADPGDPVKVKIGAQAACEFLAFTELVAAGELLAAEHVKYLKAEAAANINHKIEDRPIEIQRKIDEIVEKHIDFKPVDPKSKLKN